MCSTILTKIFKIKYNNKITCKLRLCGGPGVIQGMPVTAHVFGSHCIEYWLYCV